MHISYKYDFSHRSKNNTKDAPMQYRNFSILGFSVESDYYPRNIQPDLKLFQ